MGFNHLDYCTEPTLRLDMDPNTPLVRYNNNIIAYFSTYMYVFRAIGNQIQVLVRPYRYHFKEVPQRFLEGIHV